MKRTTAPVFWPIHRKDKKFIVKPAAGPHSQKRCMPVAVVLRDVLRLAENMKEVKEILNGKAVKIGGIVRIKGNFPVGIMDTLTVGEEHYRMLPGKKGLYLKKIEKEEANIRLLKIQNKTWVRGKVQLNLFNGWNLLGSRDEYKTGDVLVLDGSKTKVLKMKKGSVVLITDGVNAGQVGTLESVDITKSPQPNKATVKLDDRKVIVPKDYIFVVGEEKPVISLGAV